jgi:hypothetical protein
MKLLKFRNNLVHLIAISALLSASVAFAETDKQPIPVGGTSPIAYVELNTSTGLYAVMAFITNTLSQPIQCEIAVYATTAALQRFSKSETHVIQPNKDGVVVLEHNFGVLSGSGAAECELVE